MKILVVDDDALVARNIEEMIENENHHVMTAANGNDGLIKYFRFRPDVVITDVHMPGKNGFELMNEIRMHDPDIRAIYMSADPHQAQVFRRSKRREHPAAFLKKPFLDRELMRLLFNTVHQ